MRKSKILIIDDNEKHNEVMKDLLLGSGFKKVEIALDGESGFKKCKKGKFDLVIIDTVLPGIDGFEVCRKIRKTFSKTKPRIIVMTGYVDAINAIKARELGADDYVVKNSDFSLLFKAIKKILK